MGDITAGYFSSHKLSCHDLDSLQSKPEQFNANLSIKDKIFDFLRMVLCYETKGQGLAKLNQFMHENHLAHSPVELLDIFKKFLPDNIKENTIFYFRYEGSDRKFKSIEICCNDKRLEITLDSCWLTSWDEEKINNSKINVIEVIEKKDTGTCSDEINFSKKDVIHHSDEESVFGSAISRELNTIIDTCSKEPEYSKEKYNAKIMVDIKNEETKLERFILSYDGDTRLEIPIRDNTHELILLAFEKINSNDDNKIKVYNHYTSCPYHEMTTLFEQIDSNLNSILVKDKYDNRVERYKFIGGVYDDIKKINGLIDVNEIFRVMNINAKTEERSRQYINNCVINALKEAKQLQVDDDFESQQVALIKKNLNSIKQSMVNQMFQPQNDSEEEINFVDHIINKLRVSSQKFEGKEAEIESERVNKIISNINKLREHCQRSLNVES
ncbi:hypothetical protein AB8989_11530 [Yersinia hibernica]|uniref:Uncharacterized protein n=1 Tax=Yersinia hibernica TaxID=2339259 RepID=A0ABX5R578_9GAMM|nr:hypothetical protein [Yersinia hibernica]QAX80816.1 hypothetical protein D5F51_21175 [Yersinia hibernica]